MKPVSLWMHMSFIGLIKSCFSACSPLPAAISIFRSSRLPRTNTGPEGQGRGSHSLERQTLSKTMQRNVSTIKNIHEVYKYIYILGMLMMNY